MTLNKLIILAVTKYSEISLDSKVLNRSMMLDKDVWIKLPVHVAASCLLDKISEKSDNYKEIAIESIYQEGSLLRISSNALNMTQGLHQYEICLTHKLTEDNVYCFFQYLIQDDNPETPYIYMNREEKTDDATSDIFEQDVPGEQEEGTDSTEN